MGHGPQRQNTGLTRRRVRLSDSETERLMLDSALEMVSESGLTVSLDHISFEEVIRTAGASRSAVYRRWPYKEMFFSDLLKELSRGASPTINGIDHQADEVVRRAVRERVEWLKNPSLRSAVLSEALRRGVQREFENFHSSAEWRTYLALQSTFLSIPEGAFRNEVQEALVASERSANTRIAAAYEHLTALLGLRIAPESGLDFPALVNMVNATIRGFIVMASANPGAVSEHRSTSFFGAREPDTGQAQEWSQPALAVAAITTTFFEPDPEVEFDDERIRVLVEELASAD